MLYGNFPIYNPATSQLMFNERAYERAEFYYNTLDRINDQNILTQLILSRFKWSGSSLDLYQKNNYIERLLFNFGQVALYTHPSYGNIIIPCYPQGINPFGEPASYMCQSYGGYIVENKLATEIVVMRDNIHADIPISFVNRYAQKTGDVQRTEEVYARKLKNPNIYAVSANRKESAKLMQREINDNVDTIYIEENKDPTKPPLMPVSLPSGRSAGELLSIVNYRRSKFNEVLNYFGIRSDSELKSAQMNEKEISNNETISNIQFNQAFEERQRAVDEAKSRFGFDLKLEKNEALEPIEPEENNKKENENELL